MTGKHALAQLLLAEGVEYIFGNPGTSESPLLDVLQDFHQLKYVQALQEGSAVGMADGYARATGRPSFANPLDLAAIARGMGVAGEKVEDPAALGPALRKAYASGKPAVIDVSIDGAL